jgi:hypothetical protein
VYFTYLLIFLHNDTFMMSPLHSAYVTYLFSFHKYNSNKFQDMFFSNIAYSFLLFQSICYLQCLRDLL